MFPDRRSFLSQKSFSSDNSSIHNGTFFTDTQLSIGDIVKVQKSSIRRIPTDPHSSQYVTRFSPDYNVTNIVHYHDTIFIDVLMISNDIYILGSNNSNEYFLQKNNDKISLGVFTPPLSYLGNLSIINNQIYVLIYHTGTFTASSQRPSNITHSGTLFTINNNTFKLTSFRGISLQEHFMLFAGNKSLYLINGTQLSKFNPTSSASWEISLRSVPVSATTTFNMIIVLLYDEIIIVNPSNGSVLLNHPFPQCNLVCCVSQPAPNDNLSRIYLVGIEGFNVIITQATINTFNAELTILSQIVLPENTYIDNCYISTSVDGYILFIQKPTSSHIYIYNNDNTRLSTFTLHGISTQYTYQPIPLHVPESIPVLLNIHGTTYVNTIPTFINQTDIPASGIFTLEPTFPQCAGIVTDVITNDKVYVVMSGVITDTLRDLIPHTTYIVDKRGNLSGIYHNITQGKPFLIVGRDPNSASISYNHLLTP